MKSWKTTISGVLAILLAAGNAAMGFINGTPVDITATLAAIMAGVGLLMAKDGDLTGGTRTQ